MTDLDLDLDGEHQEHEQPIAAGDFDAFFDEQQRKRKPKRQPLTLYGRRHFLPESLPILFTLQAERLQNSTDPEDIRKMLTALYGEDVLDEWAAHGMEDRELGILLIWSAAAIRAPGTVSMDRAAELHDQQAAGKAPAPNRATRRNPKAKKGKKAGSSGRRS
ncbi:tail assembly chaperone [Streptomyces phage SV1]|uniref:tail assembly chaperone n=1 Tax=Streptomyces phage SV1 TaxID=1204525 RepID=UPI00028B9F13|nr:tail assembly chaperone [Streptomyces phage SV1]AFU62154.1 tail assembly chaperone [Streptomyces phage SV1]